MHTKQLLKSKLNLYCIHFPFQSQDWTSLEPHSSKFHALPLNPAYQKCLLSGFPPCALRWGFKTQIKAAAYMAERSLSHVLVCLHMCLGMVPRIWGPRSLRTLPPTLNCCSSPRTGERNILVSCALNNAIRQRRSASHIMLGIYASTCEICICNKGFSEFGVFNHPSVLGSIVFSLVIQCPHHFFLMGTYFYLFQCEKKESMFCLKWPSLPP